MFPNIMRKRILFALLMALMLLCAPLALAEGGFNPIRISTQAEPQTLTGPQSVTVTIRVVNNGEGAMDNPITIYDPNGNQVEQWGALGIGQSQSWQGSWDVTQEQIDAGRLRYSVSYTTYDEEGNPVPTTSTASVTIQKESAAPGLSASYTVSPTVVQEGQEVKLTYTLSNTGNVDLTHVRITNTGIDQKNINIASLGVGEKITREYTFEMGSKSLTSYPKVTYQADGSDTVLTYAKMAKKTIEVAKGSLEADLKSDTQAEAKPGDKVTLTLTLKNTSNLTYSGVSVEDATLGTIESGIELKPGETREIEREVIVEDSANYQFSVKGETSTGGELAVTSNEIGVTAMDMAGVVNLEVTADTETLVMYAEPSVVRFAVTVKNTGSVEGKNLSVREAGTTIATIDTLAPGEEKTIVKDLAVSMAGTFQFTVVSPKVEASEGVAAQSEVSYESNALKIAYQQPTPVPVTPVPATPEPVVTPDPAMTPEPDVQNTGIAPLGMILLYAFAGLLVAALIVVTVLIVLGRRKQAHASLVIDSYERSNARAYMLDERTRRREEARRRNAERELRRARQAQEESEETDAPAQRSSRRRGAEREAIREENDAHEAYRRPVQEKPAEAAQDAPAHAEGMTGDTVQLNREAIEQIRKSAVETENATETPGEKTSKYDLRALRGQTAQKANEKKGHEGAQA